MKIEDLASIGANLTADAPIGLTLSQEKRLYAAFLEALKEIASLEARQNILEGVVEGCREEHSDSTEGGILFDMPGNCSLRTF